MLMQTHHRRQMPPLLPLPPPQTPKCPWNAYKTEQQPAPAPEMQCTTAHLVNHRHPVNNYDGYALAHSRTPVAEFIIVDKCRRHANTPRCRRLHLAPRFARRARGVGKTNPEPNLTTHGHCLAVRVTAWLTEEGADTHARTHWQGAEWSYVRACGQRAAAGVIICCKSGTTHQAHKVWTQTTQRDPVDLRQSGVGDDCWETADTLN